MQRGNVQQSCGVDDRSQERLARNEAVFRSINNRQAEGHAYFGLEDAQEFICECADVACTAIVRLTLAEYRTIRSDPQRFIVVPGHATPGIEEAIENRGDYAVIEKVGPGARVAEDEHGGPRTA